MDRKKLALIHIVKKELGISDKDYRCLLKRIAGVESAKDFDDGRVPEDHALLRPQRLLPGQLVRHDPEAEAVHQGPGGQLGWEETHLRNFIHKYYQKPDLDYLDRKDASKLIESLKAIREHGDRT